MPANPNSGLVSQDMVSALGVLKPQELNILMKPYENQGISFFQELISMGFDKPVAGTTFTHTEEGLYNQIFTVANIADPGAGVQADLTVQAAYVQDGAVFARVGDTIMNPANGIQLRVQAKVGAVLTVKPKKAAQSIGAVTLGDTYVIVENSFGFGTGQPESAYPTLQKFNHYTQILKETMAIDGSALTDEMWVTVYEDGKKTPSYYNIAMAATEYRILQKIDGALLIGETSDNITDVNGRAIQTTQGLVPTAIAADGFLGTQTLNVATLRAIDAHMRKQFTPGLICGWLGVNKWAEASDNLQTLFTNTAVAQVEKAVNSEIYGNNEALIATIDYQGLTTNGRKFFFKNMKSWDNPTTFNTGVAGNPYQDYGIFIPAGKSMDGEGKMSSYMGVRYKSHNGYNRKMEMWKDGAAGPGMKIGDLDQDISYLRADMGAHFMKTNQWAMITG